MKQLMSFLGRSLAPTFTCLLLLAGGIEAGAVPADPSLRRIVQKDGSVITVRLCGDERFHYYLSPDSVPLVQRDGLFYYAAFDKDGLVPSSMRASDVSGRTEAERAFVAGIDKTASLRRIGDMARAMRRPSGSPLRVTGVQQSGVQSRVAFPTSGEQRALALLVTFPKTTADGSATEFESDDPRQLFDDMLNSQGFSHDGATGSVHDYFYDASNGKFSLNFDVYGPVELSKDISFYGKNLQGGDLNAWNMVIEACQQLDGEIDFSLYDRNKDGVVDNIYVFYAGLGEATGGESYTVWQHAAEIEAITGNKYYFDGVQVNRYACSSELRNIVNPSTGINEPHFEGIGTVCHEFTHVLGFPDLYDTSYSGYESPGSWSIMDIGSHSNNGHTPPTYSAYERMSLGWLSPEDIDGSPRDIMLDNIFTGKALRIATPENEDEYFILENRQQTGWDEYLPGHGLLVWHINYDADLWVSNKVNSSGFHTGVTVLPADGLTGESTRPGDAFPGTSNVTSLTDDTHPSLRDSEGNPSGVALTSITEKGGMIAIKVAGGKPSLPAVTGVSVTDITPVGFTAKWDAVDGAGSYSVDVWTHDAVNGNAYVDGFHPCRVDGTVCEVTGLSPETTYYFTVKAQGDGMTGEAMQPMTVTTPVATFAYMSPVAEPATDVKAGSFTANWQPMDGAQSYRLDVMTATLSEPSSAVVDFTGGLKAMPAGWSTNCKMTLSAAGTYGESAPSVSMSSDNSYIESAVFEGDIRTFSFWYRERNAPCGENYVSIDAMVDGSADWVSVDELKLTDTAPQAGTVYTLSAAADAVSADGALLPRGCRAVRLIYHRVGSGALAVDDITIRYGGHNIYTPLPSFDAVDVGNVTSYAVTGLPAADVYYYRVYGHDGNSMSLPSSVMAVSAVTGIESVHGDSQHDVRGIYDLNGRKWQSLDDAPKGIYVVNGRKVVK